MPLERKQRKHSEYYRKRSNSGPKLIQQTIGLATLFFGATGVFYHLQVSVDKIWGTSDHTSDSFWQIVKDRVLSFGFVLVLYWFRAFYS